ncbi:MAG TPA: hypothetical protein PKO15_04910 [Fibrobacteria bacterium]|nr:hypothetical protein [Fibrobacteria bacterium]HOX51587.1 hypothetical protein [Fibrobacteria bacterium]
MWVGILYIPLLAGHFAFPWLFDWQDQMPLLSRENSGLLWCFHVCGLFWLTSMGVATFAEGIHRLRQGTGLIGRGLWLWMAGFYLFRLVVEIPCFAWGWDTIPLFVLLTGLTAAYLAAWRFLGPATTTSALMGRTDAIAALLH